jgi:pimeloyl-ACP methyl ester carboxylesterase
LRSSALRLASFLGLLLAALSLACSDNKPSATPTVTVEPADTPSPVPSAAAPSASTTATPPPTVVSLPPPDPIEWTDCDGWQCAEITVPLDYDNPSTGEITLALTRLPASNPDARIGPLFYNPGGPGAPAREYLRLSAFAIPSEIKQRFDLVAFDPRGVGESSPILCGDNIQELIALDPDPQTDAEWQAVLDSVQAFADLCADRAGAALSHYGTINVARDMNRIRQAMGEGQISYLGFSYGTSIGQVYADLFPETVRAMVLDGALDNALTAEQRNLEQMLGFNATLNRFIEFCRDNCFSVDPQEAIDTLVQRTNEAPIPAPGADRPLTQGDLFAAITGNLYARFQWNGLANAIAAALAGDGSSMIRLVDETWLRNSDGSYPNYFEAYYAVECLDHPFSRDPEEHRALKSVYAEQSILGPWWINTSLPCAVWHGDPMPPEVPTAAGAAPILVIGNTGDPATPYKWAVALSQQLESAVLLTYDAEGHTAYLQLSTCVDGIVNAYFLDLTLPEEGTVCGSAGIEPVPPVP